jgi:hypothetical protein
MEIERTGGGISAGEAELVMPGNGLSFPIPDVTDRYILYQESKGEVEELWVLDRVTDEKGMVAEGKLPVLGPSRDDVYFQQGAAICRVENWVDALLNPPNVERIIGFPPGVIKMGISSPPAVTDTGIYASLTLETTGKLKILKIPD